MKIIYLKTIPSTQKTAEDMLKDFPPPFAVWTGDQTEGRGRKGNVWDCPEGSAAITLTLPLNETLNQNTVPGFSFVCGMGVLKFAADYVKARLKWPNDVVLKNGKKICGILIENKLNCLFCGIGVNINVKEFPSQLQTLASSLFMETKKEYDLKESVEKIIKNIFYSARLYEINRKGFLNEVRENFWLQNKKIKIQTSGGIKSGTVKGIDNDFNLLLNSKEEILKINSGEITEVENASFN